MGRFFLFFILIQSALFTAELARPVQQNLIFPWTETIAAFTARLLQLFDPDVSAHGVIIGSLANNFAVAIRPGCNGVEAGIILAAAIFAFPQASLRHKLAGFAAGFATVQALNLLRIITLFYLGQWHRTAFEWAHLYVWEVLIMLDVLIVFLVWLRLLPRSPATAEPAALENKP